jgi:hypothetical protein
VAEKTWADIEAFLEVFQKALETHNTAGRDAIDWDATTREARKIARHR